MTYPLRYVCRWCGATVAIEPNIAATTPVVFSVCDKRACRDAASAEYKAKS